MVRATVQLAGFTGGVLLMAWCVRVVMSEDNRAALERLAEATAGEVSALLGLAVASIVLNGFIFWAAIRPLHRLRLADTVAVNAIATLLSYLPFKISVIARWLIHNRRDGVPNLTIGMWFVVVAVLTIVTIAPMWLVFVRPPGVGHGWWFVVALGIAAAHIVAWRSARYFRGEKGVARLSRLGLPAGVIGTEWFVRLHGGATMGGDGHAVWSTTVARALDILSFGLRFWIAAGIIGVDLTGEEAVMIGMSYFLIGVVSPFGTVGTREAGALAMAVGAGVVTVEAEQDALLTGILLVTAAEAAVGLVSAGFALAWLRADRLLVARFRPGSDGAGAGS